MTLPAKTAEELHKLCVEIFEKTGYKVDLGDPVVAVALLQSTIMREAADHTAEVMALAIGKSDTQFQKMMQTAVDRIEAHQKKTTITLLSEVRDLLYVAPKQASPTTSATDSKRARVPESSASLSRSTVLLCALIATAAFLAGMLWNQPSPRGYDDKVQAWGRAAMAAFPQLDESNQKKITELLKKDVKSAHQ